MTGQAEKISLLEWDSTSAKRRGKEVKKQRRKDRKRKRRRKRKRNKCWFTEKKKQVLVH
jgi:hypothetical protein